MKGLDVESSSSDDNNDDEDDQNENGDSDDEDRSYGSDGARNSDYSVEEEKEFQEPCQPKK